MEFLTPILIGGTGRSGTTVVSRYIGSHDQVIKIPVESRFILDSDGIMNLHTAFTTNFSIDQARVAIRDLIELLTRKMRDYNTAPYLYFNSKRLFDDREVDIAITDLLAKITHGSFVGHDFNSEENSQVNRWLRLFVQAIKSVLHKSVDFISGKSEVKLDYLNSLHKSLIPKEKIYIPKYLPTEQVEAALRAFVFQLLKGRTTILDSTRYWCEDTPANILHIDFLKKLLPNAKFIHVMRHPVGVVHSMQKVKWAPNKLADCINLLEGLYEKLLMIDRVHSGSSHYKFIKLEDLSEARNILELSEFIGLNNLGYSGEITINLDRMNYFRKTMPLQDQKLIEQRLSKYIEYFGYAI